jgi:3-methyladenine DNA glycosylase AlkD
LAETKRATRSAPPFAGTADEILRHLTLQRRTRDVVTVARYVTVDPVHAPDTEILGVTPGKVFALAKQCVAASLADLEALLASPFYEARLSAVSIMDFQARAKATSVATRKALFELYLRRHDRINNWDMVDRAAPHVVGGYLFERSRRPLHQLARSARPCERRTAIVSTYYFIRQDDTEETFAIAARLARDPDPLVQKAVGSWVREAGKRSPQSLGTFLDAHAREMPRPMLRLATEKLDARTKARYLGK